MLIYFEAAQLYVSLAILAVTLMAVWWKKRDLPYLFFCAIFGTYLIGVASVIVFPIHIPNRNNEHAFHLRLNLIPLYFGNCEFAFLCLRNIYENILLTIPFGFGISFIVSFKPKNILWLAFAVGMSFELLQLMLALSFRSAFRAIDVTDVLLNAVGVLIGYGLFRRIFGWLYVHIMGTFEIRRRHVFAYIYDVVSESLRYG